MMYQEDLRHFQVDVVRGDRSPDIILLTCDGGGWCADVEPPIDLADLVQRASEHAEVCQCGEARGGQ